MGARGWVSGYVGIHQILRNAMRYHARPVQEKIDPMLSQTWEENVVAGYVESLWMRGTHAPRETFCTRPWRPSLTRFQQNHFQGPIHHHDR